MRQILLALIFSPSLLFAAPNPAKPSKTSGTSNLFRVEAGGKLLAVPYTTDGDALPDFSHCGYGGGGVPLPVAPIKIRLAPSGNDSDDTARIQAAIDRVSALAPDARGLRGAVGLRPGRYRCDRPLKLSVSGVILRGEGPETVLVATAKARYQLIEISGSKVIASDQTVRILDAYVPVGARTFAVDRPEKFAVGQPVFVRREGNADWIREIGMDRIKPLKSDPAKTKQWEPFALDSDRVITAIEGNRVTVDAPITCAIDARWGGGSLIRLEDAGRVEYCGVEQLRGISAFDPAVKEDFKGEIVAADETHAEYLVAFSNAKNCWARDLVSEHFYHGVAVLNEGTKGITVMDCRALAPVARVQGGRRYAFAVQGGQLSLFVRCFARESRHAFVFGGHIPGPNVFLECTSEKDYTNSEPHHRWSTGGLYDNVTSPLAFQDRQNYGTGHGWAGANYVAWNCRGPLVCQKPPTAENFAIGQIGEKLPGVFAPRPDGWWESRGTPVVPRSLYRQQLQDRLGPKALAALDPSRN